MTNISITKKLAFYAIAITVAAFFIGVQAASAAPLADGLVGYWNMDGDASEPVNNLDGTVNGDTSFPLSGLAIGSTNNAAFDGAGDFIEVADDADLDLTTALTVGGWIYVDSTAAQQGTVASKWGDLGENERGYLLAVHTDETPRFYISSTGVNFPSAVGAPLSDGWHYLVGTFDGANIKLYVDGVLAATTPFAGSVRANNESLLIGANDGFGGALRKFTTGGVDEVRIYNRALSAGEVDDLYTYGFEVSLSQTTDVNPVGTDHTVTATLDSALAYIPVLFEVSGANVDGGLPYLYTDGNGEVEFTYTGTNSGEDTIIACVDTSWFVTGGGVCDVPFDEPSDSVIKTWFVQYFVTGGGVIKEGKKTAWTYGGTVGRTSEGDIVGNLQIVDHIGKKSCHFNTFTALTFAGVPTGSPAVDVNEATFDATGTCNNGDTPSIHVVITDKAEPGAGADTIVVTNALVNTTKVLSGGNFQVHPPVEDGI